MAQGAALPSAADANQRGSGCRLMHTPGNDGIFDPRLGVKVFKILPGEFLVTRRHEALTTVLGSCIAACMYDPRSGIGGMNHFMLPASASIDSGAWAGETGHANRYGAYAMESLINALMKHGADRARLEAKLFGGAAVIRGMSDVGAKNIEFARRFLRLEGIPLLAESVGEATPRRVNFFAHTGEVLVRRLRTVANDSLAMREREYLSALTAAPASGDVELFDG
jgi:chemotaxis protein CheD